MLRPPSPWRFKTYGSHSAMDQLAAERNAQKLSIRYVSGPRNQKFFPFSNFLNPATIRIDNFLPLASRIKRSPTGRPGQNQQTTDDK